MIADPNARAATFGLDSALRLPFWAAVKTGTSKAMRDNWCIGFSRRFTVGVWVGNAEGDPMRAVSGTSGAAPVWREVMMALAIGHATAAPPMPAGIEARRIAFTGTPEQPRREYFLTGTGQSLVAAAPAEARRPRIVNPRRGQRLRARSRHPAPTASGWRSASRARTPRTTCCSTAAISAPPTRTRCCCRSPAPTGCGWSMPAARWSTG